MWKFVATALACALFGVATPAGAVIAVANLSGDWNDHSFFDAWELEIKYDTSKMYVEDNINEGGDLHAYSLTPDAIIYAKGAVYGSCKEGEAAGYCANGTQPPDVMTFDVADEGLLSIYVTTYPGEGWLYVFYFSAPDVDFGGVGELMDRPVHLYSRVNVVDYGWYGSGSLNGYNLDMPHTESLTVSVPEPQTWALMLAGFALVGAAIRRRRAAAVPA